MNNVNIAIGVVVAVVVLGFIVGMVRENNMHAMQMNVNAIGRTVPSASSSEELPEILLNEINDYFKMVEGGGVVKESSYVAVPASIYYTILQVADLGLYIKASQPRAELDYIKAAGGKAAGRIRNTLIA